MESERATLAAKEAEGAPRARPVNRRGYQAPGRGVERAAVEPHAAAVLADAKAAILMRHYFLWVRCPACRTTAAVDLRGVRTPSRPQRKSFSFDRAAVCTAEFFQRKIAVSRMEINDGLHRRLAASGTRIIETKAQRHVTPPLARRAPCHLGPGRLAMALTYL
jgi:hypothetical protein